jgi:hypothetical protein
MAAVSSAICRRISVASACRAAAVGGPPGSRQKRYQPPDPLLEFLENL